ncbi:peptidyl-prolyl cis-trans isomerase [Lysobacter sp. A3-1-A15]|uniref:peptidyl-prolyl cis-trans isomerase n=1 Tax=Novilysobacter viscosus TaxID=3098602 RepID=UPI002ED99D41
MLQKLREKTTGVVGAVIVALLIVPFALFGLDQYMVGGAANNVARIQAPPTWWHGAPSWWPASMFWRHQEVTVEEFRNRLELARQQQRERQGEAFDPVAFESVDNKREVLETLIDEKALAMAAEASGIVVGDAMVRDAIQDIEAFQVEGRFDPNRYQLTLASQVPPQTPRQFERSVRDNLRQSLAATAVGSSSFVTNGEMDRLVRLLGEQRDVDLLMLPAPEPDTAPVSDEQARAWYTANESDFRAPEAVTLEYVQVNADTVPAPAAPDEAALRQRYEEQRERFSAQDERLASHILVRVEDGADEAAVAAARGKAARIAAQAKAPGADFAALARDNSDDSGSSAMGGDLGWIGRGAMTGSFEDSLFAMQPGQVSDPVRTDFGWHVIQLREERSGETRSFEDSREALATELAQANRDRAVSEFTSELVDRIYRNPSSLTPAANEMGLQVQTVGPFTRANASGIAAHPAVRQAAFSEMLVQDGTVSDPIEVAPGSTVLIRVVEHTPERALPLGQVRARVDAAVRADRARKAVKARGEALVARLEKGETLESLATAEGLAAPESVPGVPRGAPLPEPEVNEAVFAAPKPAPGGTSPGLQMLSDGRAVLFVVTGVTPGSAATLDQAQRDALRQQFAQVSGLDDIEALTRSLRRNLDIEVFEENF